MIGLRKTVLAGLIAAAAFHPSSGKIIFHSDFEFGETYCGAEIKAGATAIHLVPNERLEEWPIEGGMGVVEGNLPEKAERFQYQQRKGTKLVGVTGLKLPHPRWAEIQTGDFSQDNWITGKGMEPARTIRAEGVELFGRFAACLSLPKEQAVLEMTIPNDFVKGFCRFYVVFEEDVLIPNDVSLRLAYCMRAPFTFPRVGVISPSGDHPRIDLLGNARFRELEIWRTPSPVSLKAGERYCVEYGVEILKENRFRVRLWVNEELQAMFSGVDLNANSGGNLFRIGVYQKLGSRKGSVMFDEIAVSDLRIGSLPAAPRILEEGGRLRIHKPAADSGQKMKSRWQISPVNAWRVPYYDTGINRLKPFTLSPVKPGALEVSRGKKGITAWHLPGLNPGSFYYARARIAGDSGLWGAWSEPIRFRAQARTDPIYGGPTIRTAYFAKPGGKRPVRKIEKGEWYDLRIQFDNLSRWGQLHFIDVYLSHHSEDAPGGYEDSGGELRPGSNYPLSLSVTDPPMLYAYEERGSERLSSVNRRQTLYCDNRDNEFEVDPSQGLVKARIRLPKEAKSGLWLIRHFAVDKMFQAGPLRTDTLHVAQPTVRRIRKPGKAMAKLGAAFLILASFALVYLIGRRQGQKMSAFELDKPEETAMDRVELDFDSPYDENIKKAREFIAENYTKGISPRNVADAINVSPGWLSHFFKKGTGKTVIQYLHEIRMEHAKSLLVESKLNVEEIASEVGFRNAKHFSDIFKKHEDLSPSVYRDRNS